MKRILAIGEKSYIGKSFENFAKGKYEVKMLSSRNQAWKSVDFTGYDTILHCAGIAHVSQNSRMKKVYYDINCNLALDVAKKAQAEKVKQFIFLSSILIYGNNQMAIDHETIPHPNSFYGESKLKAESELRKLTDDDFTLCIIRLPMVYGSNCKGNFYKLVNLAKITPIFPDYSNMRSMIYIGNLCNFLGNLIDNNAHGIFLPQNNEYVNTTALVCYIAKCYNRRIFTIKFFNPLINLLTKHFSFFLKLFGNLYYVKNNNKDNNMIDFEDSIKESLGIT